MPRRCSLSSTTLIMSGSISAPGISNASQTGMVRLILFDIDGTLVHTGGAGVRAFAKTFTTEFNAVDGIERMKFAGRTDTSLVREFFGLHQIAPTPQNFERFFE